MSKIGEQICDSVAPEALAIPDAMFDQVGVTLVFEPEAALSAIHTPHRRRRMAAVFSSVACVSVLLSGCEIGGADAPTAAISTVASAEASPTPTSSSPAEAKPITIPPPERVKRKGDFSADATWMQNFETMPDGHLDTTRWNILVGPPPANSEAEYYTDNLANVRIEKGALVLEAQRQVIQGYNYTSGRIDTSHKEDFMYGKFVIRAEIPVGIGTWPSMWLLPSDNKYQPQTNVWNNYLNDGEIDIGEAIGTEPNRIYGVAHNIAHPPTGSGNYFSTKVVPDSDKKYHNYGLEWTPSSLKFSIDDKLYYQYNKPKGANYKSWPYDQPYYLILNLALGGTWGGMAKAQYPPDGVDSTSLPARLSVQSISYYSYMPAPTKAK